MTTATKGTPVTCSTDNDDLRAQLATVTAERDAARAALAKCQAELTACRTRGRKAEARLAWNRRVLENKAPNAQQKVTALVLRDEIEAHGNDGWIAPKRPEDSLLAPLSWRAGCSTQSIGTSLEELKKLGAVEKDKTNWPALHGETPKPKLAVRFTDTALTTPGRLAYAKPEEAPQRGGKRVRVCEACGSRNLTTRCGDCGVVQDDEHPVYTELTPELEIVPVEPTPDPTPEPEPEPTAQETETQAPSPECQIDTQADPEPIKFPGRFCPNNPNPPFEHPPIDLESGHTVCRKCGTLLGLWERNTARRLVRVGGAE